MEDILQRYGVVLLKDQKPKLKEVISKNLVYHTPEKGDAYFHAIAKPKKGPKIKKKFFIKNFCNSRALTQDAAKSWIEKLNYDPLKSSYSFITKHEKGYSLSFRTSCGKIQEFFAVKEFGSMRGALDAAEKKAEIISRDPMKYWKIYNRAKRKKPRDRRIANPDSETGIAYIEPKGVPYFQAYLRVESLLSDEKKLMTKAFRVENFESKEAAKAAAREWRVKMIIAERDNLKEQMKRFVHGEQPVEKGSFPIRFVTREQMYFSIYSK